MRPRPRRRRHPLAYRVGYVLGVWLVLFVVAAAAFAAGWALWSLTRWAL